MGEVVGGGRINVISELYGVNLAAIGIDKHQLYLHFIGNYALYVNGNALAHTRDLGGRRALAHLGKSRKIWGELHKYAVAFNASHNTRHGLTNLKACGVFFPRAKQLAHAHKYSAAYTVNRLDNGVYPVTHAQSVRGVRDTGNGDAVYGEQGSNAAAYIHKRAKAIKMCDLGRQNVPRAKIGKITHTARSLRFAS